MERLSFSPDVAFTPRDPLLDRVTIAPLTAPFESGCPVQAAIFRVAPGGGLGVTRQRARTSSRFSKVQVT
jgi:hypothetical protein